MVKSKLLSTFQLSCDLFKGNYLNFFKYILLIMLLQLSQFFLPFNLLCPASPHPSSRPWVVHISSLASPFPILFLTSLSVLYLPILILKRGEGKEKKRERNVNMREKLWLVALHRCPDQGPNLQPRHVSRQEIELATVWFEGKRPTN